MPNRIRQASWISLLGFILSGPVGFLLVRIIRPQPEWTGAGSFAEHYHIIQSLPYFFGFLLLAGQLLLVLGHYELYSGQSRLIRFRLLIAVVLVVVFCTLISFNYIVQTTFVHNLAWNYQPAYDSAIQYFSMSNTLSLAWAIELWGYGILGISLWLLRDIYTPHFKIISTLLWINLFSSIIPILWTILDVKWVLSPLGIGLYFFWNLLMILIMILVYKANKNPTSL